MPSNSSKKLDYEINGNGCYICTSHKAIREYAGYKSTIIRRGGKNHLLHRWIYEEMFGEIPKGHVVRHKCDNGLCFNPEHLETGTRKENSRDMVERGRAAKPNAILNEKQVEKIKSLFGKHKQTEIARLFNISPQTVCDIKKGRIWSS